MDVQGRYFHIRKLALYRRIDVSAFDNLIAIARCLAAHSPSERAALQKADIARLLIRGGEPHQEAAASRRSEYEIRTVTARRSSQRLTAFAVKAAGGRTMK